MTDLKPSKQRMSHPNDARALRSRDALRAALLALVEHRPLEAISIRDITNAAGVSYPVFFRRYENKQQLMDDIATKEVRNLLSVSAPLFDANRQVESVRVLCDYIVAHRALWTQLLTGGAASVMRDEFKRAAREVQKGKKPMNPWLPSDLAETFVVSGLFEILSWWLSQPKDYPVEKVVRIIEILILRLSMAPLDDAPQPLV